MKTIYLVRHGESQSNTGPIRALPSMPLTGRGVKQAQQLAERCLKLPIETIVTGTAKRTLETSQIVAYKIQKPVECSDLFMERRKPSIQNGRFKKDPEVMSIDRIVRENFHVPGFRYSDEENFEDLKVRAGKALNWLKARNEEYILVVTHRIIIRVLIARAIIGEELTGLECEFFIRSLRMENSGMSVLVLSDNLQEEGVAGLWQLWAWNDYTHLEQKALS